MEISKNGRINLRMEELMKERKNGWNEYLGEYKDE